MDKQLEEYRRKQQERYQNNAQPSESQRQQQELEDLELAKKLQEEFEREAQSQNHLIDDEQLARQLEQQRTQNSSNYNGPRPSYSQGSTMYSRPQYTPPLPNHFAPPTLEDDMDDMDDLFEVPTLFAPPMPFGPPSPFGSPSPPFASHPSPAPMHPLFQLLQQLHPTFHSGGASISFFPGFPSQGSDDSYESLLRLSEMIQPVNRGATQDKINELPTRTYSKSSTQEAAQCGICLADYEEGDSLKTLPKCLHSFHAACIDKYVPLHLILTS